MRRPTRPGVTLLTSASRGATSGRGQDRQEAEAETLSPFFDTLKIHIQGCSLYRCEGQSLSSRFERPTMALLGLERALCTILLRLRFLAIPD
jgi:hypothetical protein